MSVSYVLINKKDFVVVVYLKHQYDSEKTNQTNKQTRKKSNNIDIRGWHFFFIWISTSFIQS